MPSDVPSEPDSIRRNIRLIASWWHLFVFVIHPAFSWSIIFFIVPIFRIPYLGEYLSVRSFIIFYIVYVIGTIWLEFYVADGIKAQLQQQGYTQRQTTRRQTDLLLNLAVLVAAFYWAQGLAEKDIDLSQTAENAIIALLWLICWVGFTLASIGPVLWYTVRVG